MSRWFRMHDEILDDPKVQKLSGDLFKAWVNLLCLASRNDGRLPAVDDIAFALRMDADAVTTVLERLLNGGLIEGKSGGKDGSHYAPHKWSERQYKSDTSSDRVKRFRQRSKSVAETAPETETETDTTDKSVVAPRANRLPSNIVVPEAWLHWAIEDRRWTAIDAREEADAFCDYWPAQPGKAGVKLDWLATWRNWCRNSRRKPGRSHLERERLTI